MSVGVEREDADMLTVSDNMIRYASLSEDVRASLWEDVLRRYLREGSMTTAIIQAVDATRVDPALDEKARIDHAAALAEMLTLRQAVVALPTLAQANAFEEGVQAAKGMGISRSHDEAVEFLTRVIGTTEVQVEEPEEEAISAFATEDPDYIRTVYEGVLSETRRALGVTDDEPIPLIVSTPEERTVEERVEELEAQVAGLSEREMARVLWGSIVEPLVQIVRLRDDFDITSTEGVLCSVALQVGRELRGERIEIRREGRHYSGPADPSS